MIADSVALRRQHGREVIYDAEHFFDGYKANPDYALARLAAPRRRPAPRWLVLCDTNGGTLPDEVDRIVGEVEPQLPDAGSASTPTTIPRLAVANSLAAVRAGARQVQGTINGIGERCGNVDLIASSPT